VFLETAWNQGLDLYGYDNNRFLRAVESVAKYNLGYDGLPFMPHRTCDAKGTEAVLADGGRGTLIAMCYQIFNHYVNRRGLAAPYCKETMNKMGIQEGPSGHPSAFDWLGFQTLTYTLDPIAHGAAPSGVVGYWGEHGVTLSWFGSAYASSYIVKCASTANGPYQEIGKVESNDFTFQDRNVVDGKAYYYVISAPGAPKPVPDSKPCMVSQSLIAHYRFNGTVVNELSKQSGQVTGKPAYVAGPRKGKALEFDGNTFVTLPKRTALSEDITIALWLNWAGGGDWQRAFDFGGDVSKCMFFTPRATSGGCRFEITTTHSTEGTGRLDGPALPQGKWVHVAITLKGDTSTLYLDGQSVATATINIDPLFTQNQCFLGKSQYSADPLLRGRIADLQIYNYAITPSQIQQLARGED